MAFYKDENLHSRLKELKVLDISQLEDSFQESQKNKSSLASILLKKELISDENLAKLIADISSLPFIRLSGVAIDKNTLNLIPEVVAKKQRIIAFKQNENGLSLAMADPANLEIIEFIKKKIGLPVIIYYASNRDIEQALSLYAEDVEKAFDQIIIENVAQAKGAQDKKAEPSIIKIVNTIIKYAQQNKVSDIHIEPAEEYSLVRFRIDGILHDIVKLPADLHPQIVTRIKVLSKLRTDEHQAPQDGKFQWSGDEQGTQPSVSEKLDIRVSVVPVTGGEKIVMRILSESSRLFSLTDLGFSASNLEKIQKAYTRSHGMLLSTGPTGCGKTTTMYAILKILNKRQVNIMTIEDPVEYDIEKINQIQVNPKTELTFAKGLRSVVRQDPDIILVGEIRDEETAGIAINSAMTGHLVLSTLHTNDASTTIPRLLDMGIEAFLIASSINVIVAQRLVRKICQKCRISREIRNPIRQPADETRNKSQAPNSNAQKAQQLNNETMKQSSNSVLSSLPPEMIKKHFSGNTIRIYHGKGCSVCHQSGYVGRIGIFEVLLVNDNIRQAIVSRKDASAIKKAAVEDGLITMLDDGIEKIKQGVTTAEEIVRVTKE